MRSSMPLQRWVRFWPKTRAVAAPAIGDVVRNRLSRGQSKDHTEQQFDGFLHASAFFHAGKGTTGTIVLGSHAREPHNTAWWLVGLNRVGSSFSVPLNTHPLWTSI